MGLLQFSVVEISSGKKLIRMCCLYNHTLEVIHFVSFHKHLAYLQRISIRSALDLTRLSVWWLACRYCTAYGSLWSAGDLFLDNTIRPAFDYAVDVDSNVVGYVDPIGLHLRGQHPGIA